MLLTHAIAFSANQFYARKSRDGTARYGMGTFYSPQADFFWVFPRDGTGKCFRLFTAGWEWDGKVGSHLVDETGRDYTIFWWDGAGRNRGKGREQIVYFEVYMYSWVGWGVDISRWVGYSLCGVDEINYLLS